ncbi:MAG: PAS domain S-box protein [Candidatus Brocadia sp.]|nr:PAS domain S-box protein [Candidatus Brocadia sp.]
MIGRMADNMRKTGIDIIGDVPWGTHFCQFYQTKEDLTDILVPYFKTGLESNEFCMWITSAPLTVEEARDAMKKEVCDFELYANKGQIEIIPHTEWYLKDGVFNLRRVLNGWVDKLNLAMARGYEGMRITGNTAWLEKNDWRNFAHYEEEIDNVIGKHPMMAICSYSLDTCGAYEIIDVVRNHQFALIKREGRLELFESSERRHAMEALRMSEEKYRILYETIRDGIVATDMDGHILECNQAYVDMLGYSKDEIMKLTYHQLTPEKWHRTESRIVKELIIGRGYSDEYEKEYRRKDGTVFPISIRVWLIRDGEDKPKGMWGIIRDITARKRMEEELQIHKTELEMQNEELRSAQIKLENLLSKYSDLYDFAPVSYFTFDKNGLIIEVNLTGSHKLSKERISLIKKPFSLYVVPADKDLFYSHLRQVFRTGARQTCEIKLMNKNGVQFYAQLESIPVRNNDADFNQCRTAISDITDHKRLEDELRKLSNAIEQSPCSIVITDTNGNIEYVNPKFCKTTGYTPEEAIGQNTRILKSGEKPPEEYKCLWDTITTGNEWRGELHNKKKCGERYWEYASISPIKNSEGVITHFLAVKEDITKRKHAEDELRKQRDSLEYITRQLTATNKELEAFCYSVSHDLRAPLRSIDGFSKVLMEDYADKLDVQARKHLQRVCAASQHMGQLIDDLLNLSRIARREICFVTVNLSELVRSIANELQEMQPERKVEFIIANGLITKGDSNLLRIAFKNLLSNAWKFTRNRQQARIEFGITQSNEKSVYFVRDNGVGFDMAYVNKLFGAFQRLHMATEFEGTGIGLAIVQRVIQRHGGHIWAEGEVDKGAVFYFII